MPGFELIDSKELSLIKNIFKNGSIFYRYGFEKLRKNKYYVKDFERKFSNFIGNRYSLAVSSGTAALRVALAAIDIKRGDEIITQSFTFVATVEAIVESGAKPICTEIDETLNMDPHDLEKKITTKTKAVIFVHMLGSTGKIDIIKKICKKNNLILIEDTAWGLGSSFKGKKLGNIGDIGTFSFDFAKIITTGEGGMLTFKNKKNYLRAAAWHDHGHENNPKFPRWEDTRSSSGFNYRISEVTAAIGIAQLKKLEKIRKLQRKNYNYLFNNIKNQNIKTRPIPKESTQNCDALILILPSPNLASKLKNIFTLKNISTKILPEAITWHFSKYWTHIPELKKEDYKKSHRILSRCVSLPINCVMKKEYLNKVVNIINNYKI